jgi:hypothetical protein
VEPELDAQITPRVLAQIIEQIVWNALGHRHSPLTIQVPPRVRHQML